MDGLLNGLFWLLWFAPFILSTALTTAAVLQWRHEALRLYVPVLVFVVALTLWPALIHDVLLPPVTASVAALTVQAARRARCALLTAPANVE